MRRGMMKPINCILALVLCLLLLTSCISDAGALLPTEESEATAGQMTDSVTDGQTKPEAEAPVFHPVTYQVDLSHDEIPEELVLTRSGSGDEARMELTLTQEGKKLWSERIDLERGMTKKAYYLCKVGDEDFLAKYRSYLADGAYRYVFEVFDLEGKRVHYVDYDTVFFGINAAGGYPVKAVTLGAFSNRMNGYMSKGFLLAANTEGTYTYSTLDIQKTEQEQFMEVFVPASDYEDCKTITEKVYRYNVLHDEYEGNQAVVLVKPEGFDDAAREMLSENAKHLSYGSMFLEDRESWFADYNDWAIQVARYHADYSSPLDSENAVFYYADEEMTLEEIAAKMVEILVAEGNVQSEERTFVIASYRILEPKLIDSADNWNLCLKDWSKAEPSVQANIRAYIRDWLLYRANRSGFIPIGEDMWYFVPKGYYSFSGAVSGKTMTQIMKEIPEQTAGGKVPLVAEGDEENYIFVLMKQDNVYRLQSIKGMQKIFEGREKR